MRVRRSPPGNSPRCSTTGARAFLGPFFITRADGNCPRASWHSSPSRRNGATGRMPRYGRAEGLARARPGGSGRRNRSTLELHAAPARCAVGLLRVRSRSSAMRGRCAPSGSLARRVPPRARGWAGLSGCFSMPRGSRRQGLRASRLRPLAGFAPDGSAAACRGMSRASPPRTWRSGHREDALQSDARNIRRGVNGRAGRGGEGGGGAPIQARGRAVEPKGGARFSYDKTWVARP